jgi:hypothetical protein
MTKWGKKQRWELWIRDADCGHRINRKANVFAAARPPNRRRTDRRRNSMLISTCGCLLYKSRLDLVLPILERETLHTMRKSKRNNQHYRCGTHIIATWKISRITSILLELWETARPAESHWNQPNKRSNSASHNKLIMHANERQECLLVIIPEITVVHRKCRSQMISLRTFRANT